MNRKFGIFPWNIFIKPIHKLVQRILIPVKLNRKLIRHQNWLIPELAIFLNTRVAKSVWFSPTVVKNVRLCVRNLEPTAPIIMNRIASWFTTVIFHQPCVKLQKPQWKMTMFIWQLVRRPRWNSESILVSWNLPFKSMRRLLCQAFCREWDGQDAAAIRQKCTLWCAKSTLNQGQCCQNWFHGHCCKELPWYSFMPKKNGLNRLNLTVCHIVCFTTKRWVRWLQVVKWHRQNWPLGY